MNPLLLYVPEFDGRGFFGVVGLYVSAVVVVVVSLDDDIVIIFSICICIDYIII